MAPFIPLLVIAAALVVFLVALPAAAARRRTWQAAARELGLDAAPSGPLTRPKISGQRDGAGVDVHTVARGGKNKRIYSVIVITAPLPRDLVLSSEGLGSALGKVFAGRDLTIGDRHFDQKVLVRGAPVETAALLDADTRSRVLALLKGGGKVEGGAVRWERRGHFRDASEIVAQVQALIALAHTLQGGSDPAERLGRGAVGDPLAGVRLKNLELLLETRAGWPATLAVSQRCLDDPDPAVAMTAALALGDVALERVEALLRDPLLPPLLRIQALQTLGARGEAIGAIQARCGGGERGAFALSDSEDAQGALSLSRSDQRGAISAIRKDQKER